MGWTKRQLVEDAFDEIGLASYIYSLTPDQLQSCLRKMDSMIGSWGNIGVRMGYAMHVNPEDSALEEDSGISTNDAEAVIKNLAVRLAPSHGKTLSIDTKSAAADAYNSILAKYVNVQERNFPTTLPIGAGNKTWRNQLDPFARKEDQEIATGKDDILDI